MKALFRLIALSTLLTAVAGCSSFGGGKSDDDELMGAKEAAYQPKYAITLRFTPYDDRRQVNSPRYVGKIAGVRVRGISGEEVIADKDVAELVTTEIKRRFDAAGYQVLEDVDESNALYEVSGVIKALSLDIKYRDEVYIAVETTLKDVATGEVFWSGVVTEQTDRFAGVSGNNKEDVFNYLDKELRIMSARTVNAVSASMRASRPEWFNLASGVKAASGVDVLVSPSAASSAAVTPAIIPANKPLNSAATGMLSVHTTPSRAKIYLDGVYFGLSPLDSEIEPGVHDVVVKLNGYKTATEKVSVRKGDKTELELSLDR